MKKSEGNAMNKDIEWLKAEVEKQDIVMDKGYIYTNDLIYLIDQLDEPEVTLDKAFEKISESYPMKKEEIWRHLEQIVAHGGKVTYGEPEVLSQDWIDGKTFVITDSDGDDYAVVAHSALQNLLVPKQEPSETSAPLIVSGDLGVLLEDMELGKSSRYFTMIDALFHYWDNTVGSPIGDFIAENKKELIEVILGNRGYEVDEVPLYHALIKGYELLNIDGIYWTYDKNNYDVIFSELRSPHGNFSTELSKIGWNKLGINDSNAYFVKVDE